MKDGPNVAELYRHSAAIPQWEHIVECLCRLPLVAGTPGAWLIYRLP